MTALLMDMTDAPGGMRQMIADARSEFLVALPYLKLMFWTVWSGTFGVVAWALSRHFKRRPVF
jgi:hypothetical protein